MAGNGGIGCIGCIAGCAYGAYGGYAGCAGAPVVTVTETVVPCCGPGIMGCGYGMDGIGFWTKKKKITARWPDGGGDGSNAFVIPTMG